ncbi:MAG: hypothetical protein ACF8CQ_14680 [Rhodopirellula sp. JB044]|uniref:hypothetical protein n=1 Tax=Rhodopirellula sp. JB044 TaxID=3342844 RepID=UPI00370AAAF6
MHFSVAYETTELISPLLQQEMIAFADELSSQWNWLSCEPPCLSNRDGILAGASKPNFSGHVDRVASDQVSDRRDGTLNDLVRILCAVSAEFDVDWLISHDCSNGPLGFIRCGRCDEEVRSQCDVLSELTQELGRVDLDLGDF